MVAVLKASRLFLLLWLALATGLAGWNGAAAEPVRDLATISGVQSNELVGYGLVVGLNGTGDQTSQTPFTIQSIENMLTRFGVNIPSNVNPQLKNVAAVMVTASLPPFASQGQHIDVTVSSIGNAKSLRGGVLLMTLLRAANGQVYALAQGNLVVAGYQATGPGGATTQVNTPTVGLIPSGATIERSVSTPFDQGNSLTLNLDAPSFTTANRVAQAINQAAGPGTAEALNAVSIRVHMPANAGQRVAFVSFIENLDVNPAAPPAQVIVDARTGTVIIGAGVTVLPAAVAHGNLSVTIKPVTQVSQPKPFSKGKTVVAPTSKVTAKQGKAHAFVFKAGTSLNSIVSAINAVGGTPDDLIAILEALKKAGALRAKLEVI